MPPGNRKINEDLGFMRELIRPAISALIPFQEENELEILSLRHEEKTHKQGLDKVIAGTMQSIYYEPMVAFAFKDYIKGSREALLLCRTRSMEFIYRLGKTGTDVFFNGTPAGWIDFHGVLFGVNSKKELARTKRYSKEMLSVFIKGAEAGHLYDPLQPYTSQQRAYSMLGNLKDEDETIFLAVTLYELLTRKVPNKNQ